MFARMTGRLITGPLAFLVAGIVDISAYALASVRRRMAHTIGRRRGGAA